MSNFDTSKWFKKQYLQEANLNEEKSKNERIFDVFYDELEDFDGVAEYLNRYKSTIIRKLESIDFDFLPKPSMMEEGEGTTLNLSKADMDKLHKDGKLEIDGHKILYKVKENLNEEMATYKVKVVLAADEGGPDYSEDVEVKVDSSLKGDKLDSAIRNAVYDKGYTRRSIYKINYNKS